MAQIETLGILQDLESLVSDQLQVVSYKWLSRNYLVSSNAAKRLLQEFVEKHGKGLEVVYSLSGWLKSNPPSYHIRLVSGPKLAEAREELGEGCSIQVYSVQACIPKDPAALWNIEFVQAEELCKQPSTVDNCLRDNRFCGISNSFVKRNVEGTSTSVSAPQLQSGVGSGPSKSNLSRQNDMVPQSIENKGQQSFSKAGQPSPDMVKDVKSENNGARVHDQDNKPSTDKEKVPSVAANKKKVQNSKSSSGTEGSLANFWSRASAKSKASSPSENNDLVSNSTGASAEAQISAQESVNVDGVNSDDDGPEMNFKRGSNGDGARKRRVVFDFSDEDEYEDAVNLASPDRGQSCKDQKQTIKSLVPEKPNLNLDTEVEDKLDVKEKVAINRGCNQVVKEDSSALVNDGNIGIPVKGKTNNCDPKNDANKTNKHANSSPESPKRRKVMKTHIDERGREVREVVWEGEETEAKKANSGTIKQDDSGATKKGINNTVANTVNRPQAPKKSPAVGNTALSGMGKKRDAMAIDFDLDCDRVTEALKKRKKKKSSKVHLSGKASGEGSARTREIENPSAAAGTVAAFANHDGAEPSHLHMPVTPTPGVTVDHDGFHLSSMTSSLRQTLGGLGYDPDNLTPGTDVCDQLYESMSRMFALSYVTKAAFDGIRERLGRRNQTISDFKAQYAVLEKETKEKDSTISSLESELQVLRERNTQLAENNNLLQIREEAAGERHRAMLEEVVGKAKMAGALWFKDNTLKRHPEAAPCHEWFEAGDGDEGSGSSDSGTDDDGQT